MNFPKFKILKANTWKLQVTSYKVVKIPTNALTFHWLNTPDQVVQIGQQKCGNVDQNLVNQVLIPQLKWIPSLKVKLPFNQFLIVLFQRDFDLIIFPL